ncbi:MAG: aminopeptidase P family N-terminal domain-containing protein, partial [Candidatus Marsarchaeota archaeon]|nr:aminopeptidase P family N-terminal domain-containing protein [Candidatus Marsarchaeota archaeon]
MSFSKRQHTLESKLIEAGLKCATFNNPRNIYYVTGFSGASPSCVLLWAQDRGFRLYVPKLELLAAEDETVGAEVVAYDSASALTKSLSEAADDVKMVGLEKDYVTLSQAQWVEAGVFDITFMIAEMRRSKDQEELAAVWKAVEIAERGLKAAFESVKPGVKEREIAANAEYEMRRGGADW